MFCHRAHYPIAYILITTLCTGLQSCLLHLFPKFKGGPLRDRVHSVVLQALLQLSQLISLDFYSHFCHVPPKVNFDHTKVSFAFSVSSAVSTFAKTRSSINMLYAALADSRDLNTAAITIQRCGVDSLFSCSNLDLSMPNATVSKNPLVSLKATSNRGGGPLHFPESVSSHVMRRICGRKLHKLRAQGT